MNGRGTFLSLIVLLYSARSAAEPFDPFLLPIGKRIDSAIASIDKGGTGMWRGQKFIITVPAIPEIFEQQRVVLTTDETRTTISAVHVQIFLSRRSSREDLLRLYEDVKRVLIERFGSPEWEERKGEFRDVDEEAVRIIEWQKNAGGSVLRAGIPRRMDGRAVIEVALTQRKLARNEKFWGAEDYAAIEE